MVRGGFAGLHGREVFAGVSGISWRFGVFLRRIEVYWGGSEMEIVFWWGFVGGRWGRKRGDESEQQTKEDAALRLLLISLILLVK